MNGWEKGNVWFYYDSQAGHERPGVIVGSEEGEQDVLLAKLTTHSPRNFFDHQLEFWQEYGLKKPSIVRCTDLMYIKKSELKFRVAKVDRELAEIKNKIAMYILK